jgi:peptidoglycan/LPS O-acetylase OafA/YrhL
MSQRVSPAAAPQPSDAAGAPPTAPAEHSPWFAALEAAPDGVPGRSDGMPAGLTAAPRPPVPAAPGRLPALDALRAVGAAAVMGTHVGFATGAIGDPTWGGWLARLDVGVSLFFVLSGFLLFRPYALAVAIGGDRPGAWRYLWRRALRILPAYWATVTVCLLVIPENDDATAADWVRHVLLAQIYQPQQLRQGLGHTWSLATEVAFYLVLPLLGMALLGRRWRPVRAVTAMAVLAVLVTGGWLAGMATGLLDTGLHTMWLPSYAGWFGAGIALAVAHVALATGSAPARWRVLDDVARAPLACWAMAVALFAVATTPLAGPRDLDEPTAGQFGAKLVIYLGVGVLVLIPVAFGPRTNAKAVLDTAPARWLGGISYGLFLWHPLVLEMIYQVTDRPLFTGGWLSTFLLTLAGGTLLATVSWYALERPLQRAGARWPRRRTARTAIDSQSAPATASARS